jgi:hypothetical protein
MEIIWKAFEASLKDQTYLLFLISVFIISGVLKDHDLFLDVFKLITKKVKSKKFVLALISLVSGVLPISGRVTVSAGVLALIAPGDNKCHKPGREKYGIIDYLATHHYYLWSPLEKTVILPMVALGLSWSQFMAYTLPLLVISLAYTCWYIGLKVEESEISIDLKNNEPINWGRLAYGFLPFISSIAALLIFEKSAPWIFSALAIYYLTITKPWSIEKINSYINWSLVGFLGLIIVLGKITGSYSKEIEGFIKTSNWADPKTFVGILAISSLAFTASWIMGSSGKFAGILALLVTIFGPHYLVWFFVVEFAGYNFSPMHKCVPIGKMYFKTPIGTYANALATWMFLLLSFAGITTFAM